MQRSYYLKFERKSYKAIAKTHFFMKKGFVQDHVWLLWLSSLFVLTSSFYMVTDYRFVQPGQHLHLAAQFREVGKASFDSPNFKHTHQTYADAFAYAYATQFLSSYNSLTWHAGWSRIHFHWPENPRFRGEDYDFSVASLAWISTSIKDWRWIISGATTVDAESFDFGHTGVYYGLFWGRHRVNEGLGVHIGTYGYYGVQNGYALPILGFDWSASKNWVLSLIFPMHTALEYHFNPYWSLSLQAAGFGIPYRFPIRAKKGIPPFENGIFELFSTGIELDLRFCTSNTFFLSIGGGWNDGGWILIRDRNNHNGKYFDFDGAPYLQTQLRATF